MSFLKKLFNSSSPRQNVNVVAGKKGFQPTVGTGATPPQSQNRNTSPIPLSMITTDDESTSHISSHSEKFNEYVAEKKRKNFYLTVAQHLDISEERAENLYWKLISGSWSFETPPEVPAEYQHIDYTQPAEYGFADTERNKLALRKLSYEMYLAKELPVFVYGTLRTGQGNYGIMEPAVKNVTPGKIYGIGIYGSNYGFPYAAEHEDPEVYTIGEVIDLSHDDEGYYARGRLDQLEGFNSDYPSDSHYERTITTVETVDADGNINYQETWVYLARGHARKGLYEIDRIVNGDWVATRENNFRQR